MTRISMMVVAIAGGLQVSGCASIVPLQPVNFPLGPGLGDFELQADQPLTKSGTADFEAPVTLRRGTLRINPDAIMFTPADTSNQKGRTTFQSTTTIVVTVWIAELEDLDNVFDVGDEYGPYTITFDENFVPVSVSPPTITLTPNTIALLNSGQFSIGFEVVSPVDGTLVVGSLTFNVGL
jgi:hypothetical protein